MDEIYKVEYVKKNNYKKYLFTKEQEELIVKLYKECGSTTKVGKMFNLEHKVIERVLKKFNVARTGAGRRKYNLNEHYFDAIDTQNKAYILGFLYADGSNCMSKGTVSMSLEERDKNILEQIRNEIGSERQLEFLDYSSKHDFGYTYKNQYRLLLFSAHMCRTLDDIGMTPNKSLTVSMPVIREDLLRHFTRGMFDGDGSVYRRKYENRNSYQHTLTITSTFKLCSELKQIVEKVVGINCHIYDASNHNGVTKVFTISGKNQIKKFMDWMYLDADLFLQRKYDRYIQYFYKDDDVNNSSVA